MHICRTKSCLRWGAFALGLLLLPSLAFGQEATPDPADRLRLRLGANIALAAFVPGVAYGTNFSARGGVQINRHFGAYLDAGAGWGLGGGISASQTGGSVSIKFTSYWRIGAMGEFDLGPFFVGLGFGLAKGSWGGLGQSVDVNGGVQQVAYVAGGYSPALTGRIGVGFGGRNRFTLALEAMTIFGKMVKVDQSASQAGVSQGVAVGKRSIGFAPGLVLGWDMR